MKCVGQCFQWFPPAETRIPFSNILQAVIPTPNSFEASLCRYLGVETCITAESARALLVMLLQALWHSDGRQRCEVLIPGYTCYSVAAAVARAGLKIGVYDLDPRTLEPDEDSLKRALARRPLAVIGQHLFGIPSHLGEMQVLARQAGACLVEDAAQGLGGTQAGTLLGSCGDFGLFSFGRGKPLPLGSGGCIIGKGNDILEKIVTKPSGNSFTKLMKTAVVQILSDRHVYGIMEALPLGLGETDFDPDFRVLSLSEPIKRLGVKALRSLEDLNAHRRSIATIYRDILPANRVVPVSVQDRPVYSRFPVLAGEGCIPQTLTRLGVRHMYPKAIIDEAPIREYMARGDERLPGAREIAARLITLPTHVRISAGTAKDIAIRVKGAFL